MQSTPSKARDSTASGDAPATSSSRGAANGAYATAVTESATELAAAPGTSGSARDTISGAVA